MSEQYFSNKPQSKTAPKTWTFPLRGKAYSFTSDTGVFSKREVDFGSRLLIGAFAEPSVDGGILDLGCGYGPIGISLAGDFPDRHITMVDINERAVSLAKENATLNKVTSVTVRISDKYEAVKNNKFAAVLTNPPIRAGKRVVHDMLEGAKNVLHHDGELWVVIQKKQGAPSAMKKMEEVFGNVETVKKEKGYYILRSVNN